MEAQQPIGQIIGNAPAIRGMLLYQESDGCFALSRTGKQKENVLTKDAIAELDRQGMIMWFSAGITGAENSDDDFNEVDALFVGLGEDPVTRKDMFSVDINTLVGGDIALARQHPDAVWSKYILGLEAIQRGDRRAATALLKQVFDSSPLELNVVRHLLMINKGQTKLPARKIPRFVPEKNMITMSKKYINDFLSLDTSKFPVAITGVKIFNFLVVGITTGILSLYILTAFIAPHLLLPR